MGRILAIDYGRKRTGLAVSDPLQIIAGALTTVDTKDLEKYLDEYIQKNDVETIVVGKPMQTTGEPSETMKYVLPLVGRLRNRYPGKNVVLSDERYTSVLAHRAMIDGGMKKSDRQNKEVVDKIAATIILQDYMQWKK